MAKTRLTEEQKRINKAYQAERDRIKKQINRLQRQGVTVDFELPEIPKIKTEADIRKLKKITGKTIIKASTVEVEKPDMTVEKMGLKEFRASTARARRLKKTKAKTEDDAVIDLSDVISDNFLSVARTALETIRMTTPKTKHQEKVKDDMVDTISDVEDTLEEYISKFEGMPNGKKKNTILALISKYEVLLGGWLDSALTTYNGVNSEKFIDFFSALSQVIDGVKLSPEERERISSALSEYSDADNDFIE